MSDAREALVQIIAGSEWDWRNITPERIADAILAAGWTPPGEADEWRRVASEQTRMERDRAEAAEAEVERLRDALASTLSAAADRIEGEERKRDEARQQLADLRARCSECGPGYRVGDEGCRHRPTPVAPDSEDARAYRIETERGEDQWWESLVEAPCDRGHRVFIDDGDGGVYACPACALLPTVKPPLEQVVDALAAQRPGSAEWTSSRIMQTARAVLALLPGRSEAEVKAEAWDEVADYLDRTNAPSLAEAARRDNPYRAGQ